MTKRYVNTAFVYAILAMVFGVFYREFTKFSGFTGVTRLSVMHTHYFMLGMFFFLLVLVLERFVQIAGQKQAKWFFLSYNIGLNIAGAAFFARGMADVLVDTLPKGLDAAISGVAGIGHMLLGLGIVLFFLALKRSLAAMNEKGFAGRA